MSYYFLNVVIEYLDIQGPDIIEKSGTKYLYCLISEPLVNYIHELIQLSAEKKIMEQNELNQDIEITGLVDLKNARKIFINS